MYQKIKLFKNYLNRMMKPFMWVVLIFPFFLIGFRSAYYQVGKENLNQFNFFLKEGIEGFYNILKLNNYVFGSFVWDKSVALFFIILPIIAITLFEILKMKSNGYIDKSKLSIVRINNSEGKRFADIWYSLIFILRQKFKFLALFLTLGFSNLDSAITSWFNPIYKSIIPEDPSNLFILVVTVVAILLTDFINYIKHRMQHEIPFFWDLHEFHHSATEMTILSKDRETPLQDIFLGIIFLPFTLILVCLTNEYLNQGYLGSFFLLASYFSFSYLNEALAHSSLKVIFSKPFSYIFMSPSLHWLHHSDNPKHYNSNYAPNFVFWDKIFGTFLDESNLKDIESYGVANSEYNKYNPIYSAIILPVIKILKRLKVAQLN